jgi:hypothetical protein
VVPKKSRAKDDAEDDEGNAGITLIALSGPRGIMHRIAVSGHSKPATKGQIKGFKTSNFLERKTAPRNSPHAGPMEHVELPKSEPAKQRFTVQATEAGPDDGSHASLESIERPSAGICG